ncbi:MAG: PilZ domain-containing protein [Nitrospirae bacterium]|nr:PilZ domain-containing protein [Nitrospirota bacterium]
MAITAYKAIDGSRYDEQLDTQLERRAYERFPDNLQARLFFGNMIYSGMVTNLSKKGMFVSTNVRFPVNTEFMLVVLLNNRTLKLPIKVRRSVKRESAYNSRTDCGIGVELLDAPQNYLDYIGTRKSSMQVSY